MKSNISFGALLLTLMLATGAAPDGRAETSVGGSNIPAAQKLFDQANKKMSSGNNAGAITDLTQALSIDGKYGKAIANRACARFNAHDYQGAIADLDAALQYFPNMPYLLDLRAKSVHALEASTQKPQISRQQANNMLMQAIVGGDMADPSTLLMMQAQRAGGGIRRPVVNPFAAHPLTTGAPVDLTPGVTADISARGGPNSDSSNTADVSSRLDAMTKDLPADSATAGNTTNSH